MDDRRGQQHAPRTLEGRDISALPTQRLIQHDSPHLQGAEAYEQEAAKLHALARQLELRLWDCSEALRDVREREQQLQTMVSAASTHDSPTAHRYDLEQARLDMESYATVIAQMREDYLALMHQADEYLIAASILRGVEHE